VAKSWDDRTLSWQRAAAAESSSSSAAAKDVTMLSPFDMSMI